MLYKNFDKGVKQNLILCARRIALLKYQRLKPLAMVFDRLHSSTLPNPEDFGINRGMINFNNIKLYLLIIK